MVARRQGGQAFTRMGVVALPLLAVMVPPNTRLLFAINTLDLYSSGVTLQSLIPRLRRLHCVAIDTVVCAALACAVSPASARANAERDIDHRRIMKTPLP